MKFVRAKLTVLLAGLLILNCLALRGSNSFHLIAAARVRIIGELCWQFQVDNGRWPESLLELRCPVDYIEVNMSRWGANWQDLIHDPVVGGEFKVVGAIDFDMAETHGGFDSRASCRWYLVSASTLPEELRLFDFVTLGIAEKCFEAEESGQFEQRLALELDVLQDIDRPDRDEMDALLKQAGLIR